MKSPAPVTITRWRARAGLTQAAAGALVYVSRRTWQAWEAGVNAMPPGLWELARLKG